MSLTIAVIDQSQKTPTSQPDGHKLVHALQHQLRSDVAPAYGRDPLGVHVLWCGRDVGAAPPQAWPIYLLDSPDVADALGYHDVDPHGRPYARVFIDPTLAGGVSLSSVVSHEAVEAFVDPWASFWADAGRSRAYALEACDPVENDSYLWEGVELSNFVTEAWFDAGATLGPFDFLGRLHAPLSMTKGGYLIVMAEGKVGQQFGAEYPAWRRELKASPQPSRSTWRSVRALV